MMELIRSFWSHSIKHKLVVLILLTCAVVLLSAFMVFVTIETITFRKEAKQNLSALADIIGKNTTAALLFNDERAATETLNALSAKPNILSAYLITRDGKVLARYMAEGATRNRPASESTVRPDHSVGLEDGLAGLNEKPLLFWDRDFDIRVVRGIILEDQLVGTVIINSDASELFLRLKGLFLVGLMIVLGAFFIATLISMRLQRLISRPILHLAQTMKSVSAEKNYAVRARKETQDEIGQLIDGFNEMLIQIQQRDANLELQRHTLEIELSERKHAEEELKLFTEKLKESNDELQQFAYIASHDLQEPLRKVVVFGDRLKTRCRDAIDAQGRDYLERIENATKRMQNFIDDLLAFSRITTKAQPFVSVDLNKIVQEVLSDLEVRIEQTKARIERVDLLAIEADPLQMRQLFQNLIGNALKFHKKGYAPSVRISCRVFSGRRLSESLSGDLCQILVEDDGIGFDEKHKDRIFEVFQRLHGRSEYQGTGIGLAVCKKIVARHGGHITARSSPGQGSTFMVTLPIHQAKGKQDGDV